MIQIQIMRSTIPLIELKNIERVAKGFVDFPIAFQYE